MREYVCIGMRLDERVCIGMRLDERVCMYVYRNETRQYINKLVSIS